MNIQQCNDNLVPVKVNCSAKAVTCLVKAKPSSIEVDCLNVLFSYWSGKTRLVDPMCGSGTVLIELAMITIGIPVEIYNTDYEKELDHFILLRGMHY